MSPALRDACPLHPPCLCLWIPFSAPTSWGLPLVASHQVCDLDPLADATLSKSRFCKKNARGLLFGPDHTWQRSQPTLLDESPAQPLGLMCQITGPAGTDKQALQTQGGPHCHMLCAPFTEFITFALSTYCVPGSIRYLQGTEDVPALGY